MVGFFAQPAYAEMGGMEAASSLIEKGSEKIRARLQANDTDDSNKYERYEKAHKIIFDTFGIKEHNRKARENQD